MRCEIVAIGTELLLGQIIDTNSAWIGEQLATAGIDVHYQVKVGDNHARIVAALYGALARSDAVICCGGLGPTQDDITREAIAAVLGVPLLVDDEVASRIRAMFASRGRTMAANNLRQAEVPRGAAIIPQVQGTAPGLMCQLGDRVIYAVPGVPHEMREMITRAVIPDLAARAGTPATIVSRTLRTWGVAESTLAELIAPRLEALDVAGNSTIAFLASGIEGMKVRITAKAADALEAGVLLDGEEAELRALIGDSVFGVDDETMEAAVSRLLIAAGLTLAVAESLTGGLMGSRLTAVPGASEWFRGGVISYATEVKQDLLGIGAAAAVSEDAAVRMASGVASLLGADIGLAVTGVAGPDPQDGQPVGTVWVGLATPSGTATSLLRLGGDRNNIRQLAVISALDVLRLRLR